MNKTLAIIISVHIQVTFVMTKLVSSPECRQDSIYINQGATDLTQRVWATDILFDDWSLINCTLIWPFTISTTPAPEDPEPLSFLDTYFQLHMTTHTHQEIDF